MSAVSRGSPRGFIGVAWIGLFVRASEFGLAVRGLLLWLVMRHPDRTTQQKPRRSSRAFAAGLLVAMLSSPRDAAAAESPIAVGEVAPPPPSLGVDAAALRAAAEGELRRIDPSRLPERRRFVVSLALTRVVVDGPVDCRVDALVRDAKTGAMIAIIEGGARAEGPGSPELRRRVADAAVRSAVRRIPGALGLE